jgi:peroxiredoxin
VAISNDDLDSHRRFAESLGGLDFPHLSDAELKVSGLYNVVNDSGNGCRRSLFVIDRDGVIRHANRAYQVNEQSQYQAVLDALSQIP